MISSQRYVVFGHASASPPRTTNSPSAALRWPTTNVQSQVFNTEIPSVGFAEVPDAMALVAWAFKDALIAKLDAEIDAEADDSCRSDAQRP